MSGMMETLVQNQSQPPLLIDTELADVLHARLQAEQKKAAVEVAASGTTEADPKEDSAHGSDAETCNPHNPRTTTVRERAARTRGAWPPVVRGVETPIVAVEDPEPRISLPS